MAFKLFGFHLHRDPDPWRHAPPWALELRQILVRILALEIEDTLTAAQRIVITLDAPVDKEEGT